MVIVRSAYSRATHALSTGYPTAAKLGFCRRIEERE
jgi:hypothetical protein